MLAVEGGLIQCEDVVVVPLFVSTLIDPIQTHTHAFANFM